MYQVEAVRKEHPHDIRRPAALGYTDSHGHVWYCFMCQNHTKNHQSFDYHQDMLAHLRDWHSELMDKDDDIASQFNKLSI